MSLLDLFKKLFKNNTVRPVEQIRMQGEKPTIGLVVTTFDKGGLEQVVLNLYLGYKDHGYAVYLMCQEDNLGIMAGQIADEELMVFNNDMQYFLKYLYKKNITVLHYHYNIFGWEEAKTRGVSTIYTMHNVYTWKSNPEILAYSKILNRMDKVVPVSNQVKDYYLARTDAVKDNLQVIYNGIDLNEIAQDILPESLKRSGLGLTHNDVVIVFVASFYPVKYQIGMIGVMEKLILRYPDTKLLFVGNSENEYYQHFQKEYRNSSAKKNMQVIPYFDHKYMGAFLRQTADIFTLPTLQEGCSNAVIEAICCDIPMVLTNVGNAMDVIYLKGCKVVNTAYENIVTTSNEQMIQMSYRKDSSNQDELVEAFSDMLDYLERYQRAALVPASEKWKYGKGEMVNKYIKLIEEIAGRGMAQ